MKEKNEIRVIIEKEEDLEKNTRERIKKLKKEFSERLTIKVFENTYSYDEIIAQVGIPFMALCEHHKIAFEGEVSIAYIPDKYITGLSKLARIVEHFLNPAVETIQERATKQILDCLVDILKPKGAMVIIRAKHGCICYRGVKKPSWTITSAVYGIFKENFSVRQEFLDLMKV